MYEQWWVRPTNSLFDERLRMKDISTHESYVAEGRASDAKPLIDPNEKLLCNFENRTDSGPKMVLRVHNLLVDSLGGTAVDGNIRALEKNCCKQAAKCDDANIH